MSSKTGDCVSIPPSHVLTVRIGYDGSLIARLGGSADAERWIAEVMTHAQALLRHPSLPTEITLKVRLGSYTEVNFLVPKVCQCERKFQICKIGPIGQPRQAVELERFSTG